MAQHGGSRHTDGDPQQQQATPPSVSPRPQQQTRDEHAAAAAAAAKRSATAAAPSSDSTLAGQPPLKTAKGPSHTAPVAAHASYTSATHHYPTPADSESSTGGRSFSQSGDEQIAATSKQRALAATGLDSSLAAQQGSMLQGSSQPMLHGKLGAGQMPWTTAQAALGSAEQLAAVSAAFVYLMQMQRSHGVLSSGGGAPMNPAPYASNYPTGTTANAFPGGYANSNLFAQQAVQPFVHINHEMLQPQPQQHNTQEAWLGHLRPEALQQLRRQRPQLQSHLSMLPGPRMDLPLQQRGLAHAYGSSAQLQQYESLGLPHQLLQPQQMQQSLIQQLQRENFQAPHQGQSLAQQILRASLSQLEGQQHQQQQQQQVPLGQANFAAWPMGIPPGPGKDAQFSPANPLLAHPAGVTVASQSHVVPKRFTAEPHSDDASTASGPPTAAPSQGTIGGGDGILGSGDAAHASSVASHNTARGHKRTMTRIESLGSYAAELDAQVELIKTRAHALPEGRFL